MKAFNNNILDITSKYYFLPGLYPVNLQMSIAFSAFFSEAENFVGLLKQGAETLGKVPIDKVLYGCDIILNSTF